MENCFIHSFSFLNILIHKTYLGIVIDFRPIINAFSVKKNVRSTPGTWRPWRPLGSPPFFKAGASFSQKAPYHAISIFEEDATLHHSLVVHSKRWDAMIGIYETKKKHGIWRVRSHLQLSDIRMGKGLAAKWALRLCKFNWMGDDIQPSMLS